MAVVLFFFMTLSWMTLIVFSASVALGTFVGQQVWAVIPIVGLIATLYTGLGGIRDGAAAGSARSHRTRVRGR
jgi:hypothetical protein